MIREKVKFKLVKKIVWFKDSKCCMPLNNGNLIIMNQIINYFYHITLYKGYPTLAKTTALLLIKCLLSE